MEMTGTFSFFYLCASAIGAGTLHLPPYLLAAALSSIFHLQLSQNGNSVSVCTIALIDYLLDSHVKFLCTVLLLFALLSCAHPVHLLSPHGVVFFMRLSVQGLVSGLTGLRPARHRKHTLRSFASYELGWSVSKPNR